MTGPRTSTVHPLPRRPWLLLPLLATVVFLPLACSDQSTEPMAPVQPSAAVIHPLPKPRALRMAASQSAAAKPLLSFATAQSSSGNGPSVLILADTDVVSTTALATSLADSGVQVTVRPAPEWSWHGTNPSLTGFDVVVHLNGATYDVPLPSSAQTALTSFVSNGGGFIGAKWNGYEPQPELSELVLIGQRDNPTAEEQNCSVCQITYERTTEGQGHPVLTGLPASFDFIADAHDAGPEANSPTVLMRTSAGGPAVAVRDFGSGHVVNFSFAANYQWDDNVGTTHDPVTLQDPMVQKLYLNAVRWAAGSGSGAPQAQNISFGPLADKVYGDADFSISATTSSGLPVSFTASGDCTVLGTMVSITAAGSCTITAHQAGNDSYAPADDVSQSFGIAKALASITLLNTTATYDGLVKGVSVAIVPAGLTTVTLSYSQGGAPASPVNAGSYQVQATLDNPNYQGAASGTLTINQATPSISWTPASLTSGTALGAAQLNATGRGIGGAVLSGSYLYNPAAGTVLAAGSRTLSVQFTPDSPNYTGANKSVSINVLSGMTFSGFYAPVRNMPVVNVANAGSSIPMKFSVGGYLGLQIMSSTAPTSEQVPCGPTTVENSIRIGTLANSGLTSQGFSYTYVWRTNPTWAGTCRKFVMTLRDGSTHEALFRFPAKAPLGAIGRRILRGK